MSPPLALLQQAIDFFEAVEIAPNRYAFPLVIGRQPWHTCDGPTLSELFRLYVTYARAECKRVFETHTVQMDTWWSPSTRIAWQHQYSLHPCQHGGFGITIERPAGCHGRRITLDPYTGKVVPV
jgi:hypothetical protein